MEALQAGLVEIVREYLLAHRLTRRLAGRFRAGELAFEEVKELAGDDESCCLFRLKERCHALFRPADGVAAAMRREALFDLAVGALFHESMKFRENLYQLEAYGPKVAALRREATGEGDGIFGEFERILSASRMRVEEALEEMEALLAQTREQFLALLRTHTANGRVTRYLYENPESVGHVFGDGLDDLLARVHGDAGSGYLSAARSYLESGFFAEALPALAEAQARGDGSGEVERLTAYAQGMSAYLAAHYDEAVACIERWLEASPGSEALSHAALALGAVGSIGELVGESSEPELCRAAEALTERIRERVPQAAPPRA